MHYQTSALIHILPSALLSRSLLSEAEAELDEWNASIATAKVSQKTAAKRNRPSPTPGKPTRPQQTRPVKPIGKPVRSANTGNIEKAAEEVAWGDIDDDLPVSMEEIFREMAREMKEENAPRRVSSLEAQASLKSPPQKPRAAPSKKLQAQERASAPQVPANTPVAAPPARKQPNTSKAPKRATAPDGPKVQGTKSDPSSKLMAKPRSDDPQPNAPARAARSVDAAPNTVTPARPEPPTPAILTGQSPQPQACLRKVARAGCARDGLYVSLCVGIMSESTGVSTCTYSHKLVQVCSMSPACL